MGVDRELIQQARKIEDTVKVDAPDHVAHRIAIEIRTMTVVKLLAILFGAYVIVQIWPLITLLGVSVMLAAALSPYLALLERFGLSRPWALTALGLSLLLGFVALLALVVPGLIYQTRDLIDHSDQYVRSLQLLLAEHGIHQNLIKAWHDVPRRLGTSLNLALVGIVFTIFDSVVALATVLFVTLYLLSDQDRIKKFFVGMFPARRRVHVLVILAELRRTVGGYVRGQLITSALAALFSFIVLTAAGVPNSITLAVYVGLMDLVPMFGGMLGMIPAVLIALTISPVRAIMVFVGFVLYQNLENHYIVPRVYAKTMRISSLVALVGLLVGARLLGIVGMLVALPIVAGLPVILDFAGVHLRSVEPLQPVADPATDLQ